MDKKKMRIKYILPKLFIIMYQLPKDRNQSCILSVNFGNTFIEPNLFSVNSLSFFRIIYQTNYIPCDPLLYVRECQIY